MSVAIEVESVSKSYDSGRETFQALSTVDLSVQPGEFVSIVGPSGCGKSTLMLIIAGLLSGSSGRVTVGGDEVVKPLTDVGVVFQNDLLLEFRSALDNVALQCQIRGMKRGEARERSMELLERIGLKAAASRYPHQLSGGMRQRVSIARAFIHRPPTLLMDEPFGALDAISRLKMQGELESLWLDGDRKTVMFITHSVEEAVRLSDRVIVVSPSPGRVVEQIVIDAPRPRPVVIEDDAGLTKHTRRIYEIFNELGVLSGV